MGGKKQERGEKKHRRKGSRRERGLASAGSTPGNTPGNTPMNTPGKNRELVEIVMERSESEKIAAMQDA